MTEATTGDQGTLVDAVTDAMAEADGDDVTFEDLARVAVATMARFHKPGAFGQATITAMEEQLDAVAVPHPGFCGNDARSCRAKHPITRGTQAGGVVPVTGAAVDLVAALLPVLEAAGHGEGCLNPTRAEELLKLVESVMAENDRLRGVAKAEYQIMTEAMTGMTRLAMEVIRDVTELRGDKPKEEMDAAHRG